MKHNKITLNLILLNVILNTFKYNLTSQHAISATHEYNDLIRILSIVYVIDLLFITYFIHKFNFKHIIDIEYKEVVTNHNHDDFACRRFLVLGPALSDP